MSGQPFAPPTRVQLVAWSGDVSQLAGRLNMPERALTARIKALAQDRNGKRLVVEVIPANSGPIIAALALVEITSGILQGYYTPILTDIARHLGLDPLAVRKTNFYGGDGRDTTPFNALIPHATLHRLVEEIELSSGFALRRQAIDAFNATSPILKKGLALTPIKYGCGFGVTFLNQGGALLHVYKDGTLHLNHGGTEMGQGLHTKLQGVAMRELGLTADRVRVMKTQTDKVPNTSATAASSGSDLNGQAIKAACETLLALSLIHISEPTRPY